MVGLIVPVLGTTGARSPVIPVTVRSRAMAVLVMTATAPDKTAIILDTTVIVPDLSKGAARAVIPAPTGAETVGSPAKRQVARTGIRARTATSRVDTNVRMGGIVRTVPIAARIVRTVPIATALVVVAVSAGIKIPVDTTRNLGTVLAVRRRTVAAAASLRTGTTVPLGRTTVMIVVGRVIQTAREDTRNVPMGTGSTAVGTVPRLTSVRTGGTVLIVPDGTEGTPTGNLGPAPMMGMAGNRVTDPTGGTVGTQAVVRTSAVARAQARAQGMAIATNLAVDRMATVLAGNSMAIGVPNPMAAVMAGHRTVTTVAAGHPTEMTVGGTAIPIVAATVLIARAEGSKAAQAGIHPTAIRAGIVRGLRTGPANGRMVPVTEIARAPTPGMIRVRVTTPSASIGSSRGNATATQTSLRRLALAWRRARTSRLCRSSTRM